MHRPSEEDKRTFVRHEAKETGMSMRAVRKARQTGKSSMRSAPMPHAEMQGEREIRYEPMEGGLSIRGNKLR